MSRAWESGASPEAELRHLSSPSPRVALVTGGTDGIGRAVALELARRGDRVLFVGRNRERGAEVMAGLKAAHPTAEHEFFSADLSLLSETARVCQEVEWRCPQLNAVVFCAGILSMVPERTQEGLERNFVLNYLTRYLMIRRLLPRLTAAPSGRIVLVANAGKYGDTLNFDDLQHERGKPGLVVSARTQFANDLLAIELAERLRDTALQVSCVFPGVTHSACFRNARGLPWLLRHLAPWLVRLFGHSTARAAVTPVALACESRSSRPTGPFFGPGLRPLNVPAAARDRERRAALWQASEALVSAYVSDANPLTSSIVPTHRASAHRHA